MANSTVTLLPRVSREISIWFCKILHYLYENNHMGPNYGRDTGKNNSVFKTICSSQMWCMGSLPLRFVSHPWPWVSVRYSLKWKKCLQYFTSKCHTGFCFWNQFDMAFTLSCPIKRIIFLFYILMPYGHIFTGKANRKKTTL